MSRVTLLWIAKGRSSFRSFSLPQSLVMLAGGGVVLLLVISFATSWWAVRSAREAARFESQSARLAEELQETDSRLQAQDVQTRQLLEENRKMSEALGEVQATEGKIRRFLGLNEQSYDQDRSHQGGMGESGEVETPRQPVRPASFAAPDELSPQGFLERSEGLRGSLEEVLAYLEDRHEESRQIPTLLPTASDKVWLSCDFGWRADPFSGAGREFHNGIDVAGPWKSPIVAPADGVVLQVGKDRLFGNYVKLKHSNKIKTLYGHLASAAVKTGTHVKRGDVIGYMGNTGRSTGTHLHYSVAVSDKYVDPQDFVWDRPFRALKL